jgi:hypothetical protein
MTPLPYDGLVYFVRNGPSVAALSAVIGDDTFLRAHHRFLWSKVRSRFQVELLCNTLQFEVSNLRNWLPETFTNSCDPRAKHGRGAEPGE